MSSDKFLRGAMILTLAGLMVKVIGSVNRILLSRLLGGEGIGLYQMAYPVYLLLLSVSAAGIPVAISIIVSEYLAQKDYAGVRQVFTVSLRLMVFIGALLAVFLVLAAGMLMDMGIIQDGRAYYALIALSPSVFFSTVLASFRGYFQGHQLMTPPALSQIIEQFIRVVTMLIMAYTLLPYGLEYAAAGAAFGAVPGSVIGLIVLGGFYRYYRHLWSSREEKEQVKTNSLFKSSKLIKRLLLLALPVSCANILVPVTGSIDALLVPACLIDSGFSVAQATTQFGYLAGMAQPLLLMATIPTMSLATSLVPAVSEAITLKKWQLIEQKSAVSMKVCCLITIPAAIGMYVLAKPISLLLYGTSAAAVAIMHTAPAIWFLGIQQITTGLLQGIGQTSLPMMNMLLGIAAKLIAVCNLTNIKYGIAGAAWATNINFAVTALLNLVVLQYFKIRFDWLIVLKIFAAALFMGAAAWKLDEMMQFLGASWATLIALLGAAGVYMILLPVLGIINKHELKQLPMLKKFIK